MRLGAYHANLIDQFNTSIVSTRSPLIHLKPVGLNTMYRESLSSYFLRLADAHSVSPTALGKYAMSHNSAHESLFEHGKFTLIWNYPCFNSNGTVASEWARLLSQLTSVNHLETLTILPLHGKIPTRNVLARTKKWCPQCFAEGLEEGVVYAQLLWSFQEVSACLKHHIILHDKCCNNCQISSMRTKAKQLPHICPRCARNLADYDSNSMVIANPKEIAKSTLIGELLKSDLFSAQPVLATLGNPNDFISKAVERYADGFQNRLASMLGKRKNIIQGWASKSHQPTFQHVVGLAMAFGCSLQEVLTGDVSATHSPHFIFEGERKLRYNRLDREKIKVELERMLDDPSPIPLSEAGRRIGTTRSALKYHFPIQCKELTARCVRLQQLARIKLRAEKMDQYTQAARELASNGRRPTRNRVRLLLGSRFPVFHPIDRDACQAACQKVIREFGLDQIDRIVGEQHHVPKTQHSPSGKKSLISEARTGREP